MDDGKDDGDGREPGGTDRADSPRGRREPRSARDDGVADGETEDPRNGLRPARPLEPQDIDIENAAFVVLGVVLVMGAILAAVAGF